jgi:hypothetical protein
MINLSRPIEGVDERIKPCGFPLSSIKHRGKPQKSGFPVARSQATFPLHAKLLWERSRAIFYVLFVKTIFRLLIFKDKPRTEGRNHASYGRYKLHAHKQTSLNLQFAIRCFH